LLDIALAFAGCVLIVEVVWRIGCLSGLVEFKDGCELPEIVFSFTFSDCVFIVEVVWRIGCLSWLVEFEDCVVEVEVEEQYD
jgi:hypothetical protein